MPPYREGSSGSRWSFVKYRRSHGALHAEAGCRRCSDFPPTDTAQSPAAAAQGHRGQVDAAFRRIIQ
ncbi:unnamed protein product [Arctogadus glacialis]